jgi:predicted deacylase
MTICLGINIIMIAATITIITTTATMTTAATDTRTELGTELGTNMTTKVAVGASPYRVELSPPDISAYRAGNTGVEYITTFDSGVAGPHVMVNAVTHGNEICGAIAVDRLFKMNVRPTRGRLSLAFANVEAYHAWNPKHPHGNRYVEEDFNRVWTPATLDGSRQSVELHRARAMRPIIDDVDLLLDIHSMQDPHGPVMICGALEKGIAFARDVGFPEFIVSDKGHANGTRMRDYGEFGESASAKNALLVECGQHWEAAAADVAWQSTWRFLRATKCVDDGLAESQIAPALVPVPKVVRITDALIANSADYRFREGTKGLDIIARRGDLIAQDGGNPVLAPYDNCVLIMPTLLHVTPGLTVVRIGQLIA